MARIIRYGLSCNPGTLAQKRIVTHLAGISDWLFVAICGPRDDKDSSQLLLPHDRAALANLAFPNLPDNVVSDTADLGRMGQGRRKSTYAQMCLLRGCTPGAELGLAVGADLVLGGWANSQICMDWILGRLLWQEFFFFIIPRMGYELTQDDLPPKAKVLEIDGLFQSSTKARKAAKLGDEIELRRHVNNQTAEFILKSKLYR